MKQGFYGPDHSDGGNPFGFCDVRRSVTRLNHYIVEALINARLPAVTLPPFSSWECADGAVRDDGIPQALPTPSHAHPPREKGALAGKIHARAMAGMQSAATGDDASIARRRLPRLRPRHDAPRLYLPVTQPE